MKELFDKTSAACSRLTIRAYSTSFSLGILCLNEKFREPIYGIYGFVRYADEIVDSFHDHDKALLLKEFADDTKKAIERKVSLNPILNSFQHVVHEYCIEQELIDQFIHSMQMDLDKTTHSMSSYNTYILGSAEVVGLMCLRVFTERNDTLYKQLKPAAMKLGSAFQKVNFLRDLKDDYTTLGRVYFPGIDMNDFSEHNKKQIEADIEKDFEAAFCGIKKLPAKSMFGVYVAYMYYRRLFQKIKSLPSGRIMQQRIRIPNYQKLSLLFASYCRHSLNMI